ncbi:MAG TPA: amidohydrolase family protein, partial [Pseudonocardiaceae bacterium]|nr:amidohydrolase family protein [Pseudonocardiaceae bacterium]
MSTTLLLDARLPSVAGATSLAIVAGTVAWAGDDSTARACFSDADEVLELHGALVTPAFVDAHVHATSAGLLAGGLDLTGCATLTQCLDLVAQLARSGTVLRGQGWDETSWPERRAPTRTELDRASSGGLVYLSRVDGHSAAVSSGLLDPSNRARRSPRWTGPGVPRTPPQSARRLGTGTPSRRWRLDPV